MESTMHHFFFIHIYCYYWKIFQYRFQYFSFGAVCLDLSFCELACLQMNCECCTDRWLLILCLLRLHRNGDIMNFSEHLLCGLQWSKHLQAHSRKRQCLTLVCWNTDNHSNTYVLIRLFILLPVKACTSNIHANILPPETLL